MATTVAKSVAPARAERPVDERQAIEATFRYFRALLPDNHRPSYDPSLEEVEKSKDGRYWLVTLGFNDLRPQNDYLPKYLQVPLRKLKSFKVDAVTGRVLSRKIPRDE